jgi:hypothetical protein
MFYNSPIISGLHVQQIPIQLKGSKLRALDGLDYLLLLITMSIYSIFGARVASAPGTVREAATW